MMHRRYIQETKVRVLDEGKKKVVLVGSPYVSGVEIASRRVAGEFIFQFTQFLDHQTRHQILDELLPRKMWEEVLESRPFTRQSFPSDFMVVKVLRDGLQVDQLKHPRLKRIVPERRYRILTPHDASLPASAVREAETRARLPAPSSSRRILSIAEKYDAKQIWAKGF
ncbi:hypothetical protein GUITHDRAFT_109845, partial [Guillardia theta CCMP2712]